MLRDTAGEKGYKQTDEMSFFNTISKNDVVFLTPLIVATAPLSLPYIANATPRNTTGHGRGEGEMYFPFASAPILWATPRNAAEHDKGGV